MSYYSRRRKPDQPGLFELGLAIFLFLWLLLMFIGTKL